MSDIKPKVGTISWLDLTVENAPQIRDFYSRVVGWIPEDVKMGEYKDFNMTSPEDGLPNAGVCHARGSNAHLPPVWLVYISVKDIRDSIAVCRKLGGKIISPAKRMAGQGSYCVIQDPAGATIALFEHE